MVVTSVISCGLYLHADNLRDLKQKLVLSYLAVALPRQVSSLGMDVCGTGDQVQMCRVEVGFSAALCWCSAADVRIAPTCSLTPPVMWP